ncbi:MAG: aldo/keto reductase [Chitinophagaceae bacterium]|nr:aldo/keto reductase [Chitinophagaceae bacterium]
MQYRRLGNTDIQVSAIGFGCMSLPVSNEKECTALIHQAMDLGINYFDTADLYDKGMNETVVGKALKEKRNKIILATKAGNQWKADGSGWDWNPRKEYILQAAEESLRRLQTDYIDLYQLHGGTIDDPVDETIGAFELLKQQGKIRQYGISSIRPNVINEYVHRSSIVSVMMQYSLADRRPEENILGLLHQSNISVLARGTLAQGLLVNKPAKDYQGYSKEEISALQKAIHSASGNERTPAQTAIQYVLHHPAIASVVAGIRNKEQLEDVSKTVPVLSAEEYQILRGAADPTVYEQHRIDH